MSKASIKKFLLNTDNSCYWKEIHKMKNPEKNAVAKLGYTITMLVVASAILICMKKYKEWYQQNLVFILV